MPGRTIGALVAAGWAALFAYFCTVNAAVTCFVVAVLALCPATGWLIGRQP